MSRAVNINASEAVILTACQKRGMTVSAIEPLVSGGTRVVLMNGEAAETLRQAFGKKVLTGAVERTSLRSWSR